MEIYVLVLILIVVIPLILIVCFRWGKLIFNCFDSNKKEEVVEVNKQQYRQHSQKSEQFSIIQIQNNEIIPVLAEISFSSNAGDEHLGTEFVKFNLEVSQYQVMKIALKSIIYENILSGKLVKILYYKTQDDETYNSEYLCYEHIIKSNIIMVYKGKTKNTSFVGDFDPSKLKFEQVEQKSKLNNKNHRKMFNQSILEYSLYDLPICIIDAFAQYLNNAEEQDYFKNNQQNQQNKRIWFIPSEIITMDHEDICSDVVTELQNYFWQFEPIKYDLQLFCKQLFFIVLEIGSQESFLVEINFSEYITIHDPLPKNTEFYNIILQQVNLFFNDMFKHLSICFSCKQWPNDQLSGIDTCLNMFKYSSYSSKMSITSGEQMFQFLKSQLFHDI